MTARPYLDHDSTLADSAESVPHAGRLLEGLPVEADRERMIAEAAYYLAQQRGFAPGAELEDWLAAEREIEALAREAI